MSKLNSDTSLPKSLTYLKPLLESWKGAMEQYLTQTRDLPWNYHERACTGFLAAAAWLSGGVALEEWRHHKANTKSGRCDLYLRVGRRNISLEAKQCFSKLEGRQRYEDTVLKELAKAEADVKQLDVGVDIRLAAVFVIPALTSESGKTGASPKQLFQAWQAQMHSLVGSPALKANTALSIVSGRLPASDSAGEWEPLGIALILKRVTSK